MPVGKQIVEFHAPVQLPPPVSRQACLMAFAILFEDWLAEGKVCDCAELAEITGLDRSRTTRIMNLRPRSRASRRRCWGGRAAGGDPQADALRCGDWKISLQPSGKLP